MAKKISIDIEVNGKMQKATLSVKKLRSALDDVDEGQQRVGKSARTQDRNMKGAAKTTSNSTKEFSKMSQGMGGLVGAYATVAASVFALSAAFQFFKNAADLAALTQGQELFAQRTGVSMKLMTSNIQEATGGMVAFKEAAQAAAIGQAAGLTADQLERLGKVAKNAGTILGRDVTDSFNRLTRGAIKAEPELLDELGIIVRIDDAAQAYARTIGKNAKDLTQFEKSQAVVNAVLEQGEEKFEDIGDSVNQVAQFGAKFQDTFKDLAEPIANVANFVAGALKDSIFAVAAVIGLLGVNILKALGPVGPAAADVATQADKARKRIVAATKDGGEKSISTALRAGKFEEKQLKFVERAHKQKSSVVIDTSKISAAQVRRDLALIRADSAATAAQTSSGFTRMFLTMRANLYAYQAEYGRVMGTLRAMTAGLAAMVGALTKVMAGVGMAVIAMQIADAIRKSGLTKELRNAENLNDAITESVRKQVEETRELRGELKPAANAVESMVQQFGLMQNFNYNKLNAAISGLKSAAQSAKKAINETGMDQETPTGALPAQPGLRLNTAALFDAATGDADAGMQRAFINKAVMLNEMGIKSYEQLALKIGELQSELSELSSKEATEGPEGLVFRFKEGTQRIDDLRAAVIALQQVADDSGMKTVAGEYEDFATRAKLSIDSVRQNLAVFEENRQSAFDAGADVTKFDEQIALLRESLKSADMGLFLTADQLEEAEKRLEALAESATSASREADRLNDSANSQIQAFKGLATSFQNLGTASDKFLPTPSKFAPVFDALDELRKNVTTIASNPQFQEGSLAKMLEMEEGAKSPIAANFKRIMELLTGVDGTTVRIKNANGEIEEISAETLNHRQFLLAVETRIAEVMENTLGIENRKFALQLASQDLTEQQASFQADHNKALLEEAKHQQKIDEITAARQARALVGTAELSEAQRVAEAREFKAAQQNLKFAQRRVAIADRLLPILKRQAELSTDQTAFKVKQNELSLLQRELSTRKELLALNLEMQQAQMEDRLKQLGADNPFADMERREAAAKAQFEIDTYNERKAAAIDEALIRDKAIDAEFALLEAKREQTRYELEALQVRLQSEGRFDEAATISTAIARIDAIDYAPAMEAAKQLNEATLGAEIMRMDLAVRDAKRIRDELKPINKFFDDAADSIRSGLKDSFNSFFDALADDAVKPIDALKDAAASTLQKIGEQATETLIVDPLLDMIPFGKKESEADKMKNAHEIGSELLKNAALEGYTQVSAEVKGKTAAELEEEAKRLGLRIAEAGGDLADRIAQVLKDASITIKHVHTEFDDQTAKDKKSFGILRSDANPTNPDGSPIVPKVEPTIPGSSVLDDLGIAPLPAPKSTGEPESSGTAGSGPESKIGKDILSALDLGSEGLAGDILGSLEKGGDGLAGVLTDALGSVLNSALSSLGGAGGFTSLFGFKKGGYTNKMRGYSDGGIHKGPMSGYPAMLHGNEAVVPLPDGKTIPVSMNGAPGQNNNVTVNVSIDNQGRATTETRGGDGEDLGKRVAAAVTEELQNQKRSGGILNPYGTA